MNPLKRLAGQTAIYGLSNMAGRLLNYLLVPVITYQFKNPADFGINAEFYAYISFINILVLYGMETSFFYFSSREANKNRVYATVQISVLVSTAVFVLVMLSLQENILKLIRYEDHPRYLQWVIFIIAFDALAAIPFARLRQENKALKFVSLKLLNIIANIAFTVFFIVFCKKAAGQDPESFLGSLYDPRIGIGYVFLANMMANVLTALLLAPQFLKIKYGFDTELWKKVIRYGSPLIIVGLAGMINETMDRILLKYLLPEEIASTQNGIYAACYKISIIITIFIQAFRFASEPFFFSESAKQDAPRQYALVMNYFVIVCSLIFLGTLYNLSWIRYFIHENYHEGLHVVPVLLLANWCLGIYYNLSVWYKISGKTYYGAYITLAGAVITLALNFYWIPRIGYTGSARATLICYAFMMLLTYVLGRQHYPVNYDLKRILGYFIISLTLYGIGEYINTGSTGLDLFIKNMLLAAYAGLIFAFERKRIPVEFRRK